MTRATIGPWSSFAALLLTVLCVACRLPSGGITVSGTDCGTTQEDSPPNYSAAARECIWTAYSGGRAAHWTVRGVTIEGDPIPATLTFDPARGLDVIRDISADRFSQQADRRVWSWHCPTMTKHVWATDTTRYSFELGGCTGDGPSTTFP
jgi:hypothetical protein